MTSHGTRTERRIPSPQRLGELAERILDDLPHPIVAIDGDGRVRYLNDAHAQALGRSRERLLGADWREALPDMEDGPLPRHARGVMEIGGTATFDCFFPPTGQRVRVDLTASDGGLLVCISEEHAREQEDRGEVARSRALQMAIAELGLRALRAPDLHDLKQEVTEHVREVLAADFCKVLRLLPNGRELLLEAGTGWREGLVGRGTVGTDLDSQAGYTLKSNAPVIVRDLREEARFRGPALLRDHQVISGMSVVIHGSDGPYGVLGVHTRSERAFTAHEVHFIQAVANVLAEAIKRHAQEEQVRGLADRLSTTLESITDGFYTLDEQWRFTYVNSAAEAVLRRSRDEMIGRSIWEAFPEAVGTRFEQMLRRAMQDEVAVRFEAPQVRVDAWLQIAAYPSSGGLAVYFQDVTERRRHRQRLELHRRFHATLAKITQASLEGRLDETFFQKALEHAIDVVPGAQAGTLAHRGSRGTWHVVAGSRRRRPGAAGDVRLADTAGPASSSDAEVRFGPPALEAPDSLRALVYREVEDAEQIRSTLVVPVRVGDEVRAYLHLDNRESEEAFGGDAIDLGRLFARQIGSVMHRMALERDLERQAHMDAVTGIPNRHHAESRIAASLEAGHGAALLFLDLDDFKNVNDVYGHPFGDALLCGVAQRVGHLLRDRGMVARWGGDEFLVLLEDVRSAEDAAAEARRIERNLAAPFRIGERTVFTSASIGVVVLDGAGGDAERALLEADIALHRAKRAGKNRSVLFTHAMQTEATRRFAIESGLRAALQTGDGDLDLLYQPRIDLASGTVVAAEALARWSHPALGQVSPAEFVPLAEASGLVHMLTRWVLDRACAQARAWRIAGRPLVVAVNLSAADLRRDDLVDVVQDTLSRHGLDPAYLELEVTETAAMTAVEDAIAVLTQLRALGVSIAIDDFGTAYASLSYLKLLPIDTLKIDRVFVSDLVHGARREPGENSIVEGIVGLGKGLGMSVVAEGLETRAQADFLRELGCDGAQGNYFGRPGSAAAILERD